MYFNGEVTDGQIAEVDVDSLLNPAEKADLIKSLTNRRKKDKVNSKNMSTEN